MITAPLAFGHLELGQVLYITDGTVMHDNEEVSAY